MVQALVTLDGSRMDETWHRIAHKRKTSGRTIYAEACAASGSPWFSGHFPNEPILPGIAVLSMVTDVIKHHESEKGKKIKISGVRNVRFRLPVKPDDSLDISLSMSDGENVLSYPFKVELNGKTACTGIVVAEPLSEEDESHDARVFIKKVPL